MQALLYSQFKTLFLKTNLERTTISNTRANKICIKTTHVAWVRARDLDGLLWIRQLAISMAFAQVHKFSKIIQFI